MKTRGREGTERKREREMEMKRKGG